LVTNYSSNSNLVRAIFINFQFLLFYFETPLISNKTYTISLFF
jgi:hypothetical protein